MSEEALANRVAEIADSQQHIDTDFARSTNATGDLRKAAALIRSLSARLKAMEEALEKIGEPFRLECSSNGALVRLAAAEIFRLQAIARLTLKTGRT